MARKQVLGKGIRALITEYGDGVVAGEEPRHIVQLGVDEIEPNPHQARVDFDEGHLQDLMRSIQEKGVIQPIAVNRVGQVYQLIAGERRWRATKMAGFETIPAIVHEIDSVQELIELSLIENIQRDDLNPIEEAEGYQKLVNTCLLTQEEIAKKVGRDRSTVANTLRLLKLPGEIQDRLRRGTLSMGHARALINVEIGACLELGRRCVEEGMTVRELEQAVKQLSLKDGPDRGNGKRGKPSPQGRRRNDPIIDSYEEKLRHRFATAVDIRRSAKKGRVEIEFYDDDDLDRILELLLADDY
jgi:ParB family chromosome partitioning protein